MRDCADPMIDFPSRKDLAALTEAVNAVVPAAAVGFVRRLDTDRVTLMHSSRHGTGEFVLAEADLPDVLRPSSGGPEQVEVDAFSATPESAVQRFLTDNGVSRVASFSVCQLDAPTRFWVALVDRTPLTGDQLKGLEHTADLSARLLNAPMAPDDEADRRRRLELTAALLPALLRVLDVREVFDRLSTTAQSVLPHDMLLLVLFSDDLSRYSVYARSGKGAEFGPEVPNNTPAVTLKAWAFDIVDDYTTHPLQADTPTRRMGARSSLRVPIKFDERLIGGVAFISFERAKYSSADVAVGRRLADYVALALSHYQLAEERRQAAVLRERAANLEMLDGLLATLTGVLDIREVFDRVSAIADKVLPHDGLSIAEVIEPGDCVRIHASHGLGDLPEPYDLPVPDRTMLTERWDYRLIDDLQGSPQYAHTAGYFAGMRSAMFVSIWLKGRLFGGLNFYSKTAERYGQADLLVARRITDHVALAISHRLLHDEVRRHEALRARAEKSDLVDELLAALTDAGDLPDVFERISAIATRVLRHDGLALWVCLADGRHARVYASSGFRTAPDVIELPDQLIQNPDWEHDILHDLSSEADEPYLEIVKMGFQSLLRVPIRRDGRLAGALIFFSNATSTFKPDDVLVARRIADRMALVLARNRELEASRRADEATERASRLEARVRALTEELDAQTGYRRVVGESPQWRQALTQAAQVAATDTTVLLLGESGTGKEVIARFLHRGSARKGGPFVALNCAALPEQLLEAELFGYERGAYTGATQSKPGQLEQAAGGTLFLDEVGEMSLPAQAKFLRVLQEREFQRLGGTRVLRSDARVVAATNRDLPRAISNGQFREDLYYRLNVFAIRLPPLRDRREDILPLSEAFLAEIGRGLGRPPGGISKEARQLLVGYHWPGNVRELRNALERAAILCDGGLITTEHLALAPLVPAVPAVASMPVEQVPVRLPVTPAAATSAGDLQSIERAMIEQALQNARFNKSKAAKALGLTRHQLYIRMRRYGFE